jgi:glucokinase
MNWLAVDVGGTHTRVAAVHSAPAGWQIDTPWRARSTEYTGLGELLQAWRAAQPAAAARMAGAGIAVAGPVWQEATGRRARVTNLSWPALSEAELGAQLGLPVRLLNDFEAVAHALPALTGAACVRLQAGVPDPQGLCLVAGAGTGLGTCLVAPGDPPRVFPGEGGHAGFAPADAWEAALAEWLRSRLGRCSREHLLSGADIARIAAFLLEAQGDAALAAALETDDPAASIDRLANAGHALALQVVERFVRIYASQLGDLALAALPRGGLYIAGGIAPRWRARLEAPAFPAAFCGKPPMQEILQEIPLYLITHPDPGLLGAAVAVAQLRAAGCPVPEPDGAP